MNTMASRIKITALSAIAAGAATLAVMLPAGAGVPPLHVTPSTLHAGDTFTASGSCDLEGLMVGIFPGAAQSSGEPQGSPIVQDVVQHQEVDWSHGMTVPEGTAPGEYTVSANCTDGEVQVFSNATITVLGDTVGSTTTTTAPVETTTTTSTPRARAAAAVTARPTYTG